MLFADYYHERFRSDLSQLRASAPPICSWDGEITIQPLTLSTENPVVLRWEPERQALFAAALFLTVLTDQVCYTYFREVYPRFRERTQYPKFRGDCPGGCRSNLHPSKVLSLMGADYANPHAPRPRYDFLPSDTVQVMESEVRDFVQSYLAPLSPNEFWLKFVTNTPEELQHLLKGRA